MDILTHRNHRVRVSRDPSCALCGNTPTLIDIRAESYRFACEPVTGETREISPREAQGVADALFVDVREPWEWELVRLPNAIHLPLGQLAGRKNELPHDRPLILYCHAGIRSLRAVEQLLAAGWAQALSLQGGIDRWAMELDSTLPRYGS